MQTIKNYFCKNRTLNQDPSSSNAAVPMRIKWNKFV